LFIETTTPERVAKMQHNTKSFCYVEIGQHFIGFDGQLYQKTSATHAKRFSEVKKTRFQKFDMCRNVTWK
jgi:hypothetical protein